MPTVDSDGEGRDTPTAGISEMQIVDTFTRLIFGDTEEFDLSGCAIIAALRRVDSRERQLDSRERQLGSHERQLDSHEALDSPAQMGDYLRGLGVREMIRLVARVREDVALQPLPGDAGGSEPPALRS